MLRVFCCCSPHPHWSQPLVLTDLGGPGGTLWVCILRPKFRLWHDDAMWLHRNASLLVVAFITGGPLHRAFTVFLMLKKVLTLAFLLFLAILRVEKSWCCDCVVELQPQVCSCRMMNNSFSIYPQIPTIWSGVLPPVFTTFYFLQSNIAFNQTIVNSCSLLYFWVCFSQEFPKVLTSRLSGCFSASALC